MSPRYVEIVIAGEWADRLADELDDAAISVAAGLTHVRLVTRDSSALYGVLDHLQALGVQLLAVHGLDGTPPQ